MRVYNPPRESSARTPWQCSGGERNQPSLVCRSTQLLCRWPEGKAGTCSPGSRLGQPTAGQTHSGGTKQGLPLASPLAGDTGTGKASRHVAPLCLELRSPASGRHQHRWSGRRAGKREMLFEVPHTTAMAPLPARLIHSGSGAEKGY